MAVKAADVIHTGRGSYLLSRLQNVGPGGLQIPTETIREVGNYKSVAILRDVPDLSFTMNSFDVSTTLEQMLTDTAAVPAGGIDMTFLKPVSILGQVKPGVAASSPYAVVRSVACPVLYPERISYRFGVQQTSTVDVTLRGDSIYYNPGPAFQQIVAGTGAANQAIVLTNPAGKYTLQGVDSRVLSVDVDGQRLVEGTDFTATGTVPADPYTATTVTILAAVPATSKITVVYFSNATLSYLQSVHPLASVLPAANKGRDVRIYIGATYDPTNVAASAAFRWSGVQSATVDLSSTITRDYEMGNPSAVTTEPEDTPSLSGVIGLRARNATELFTRLRQITGVSDVNKAIGPDNAVELDLDIVVLDSAGTVHKRLHIDDARFSLPGYQAQVGQRVDFDLNWSSDTGTLKVFSA